MSKLTPKLLLEDIIESAGKILQYTKGISFEEFSKDNKTVDAVIILKENEIAKKSCMNYLKIIGHQRA